MIRETFEKLQQPCNQDGCFWTGIMTDDPNDWSAGILNDDVKYDDIIWSEGEPNNDPRAGMPEIHLHITGRGAFDAAPFSPWAPCSEICDMLVN